MRDTVIFAQFYANAMMFGTPLEMMQRRYPQWEAEVSDGVFILRRKAEAEPETPGITPAGAAVAERVPLSVDAGTEAERATAAAERAVHDTAPKPSALLPVE